MPNCIDYATLTVSSSVVTLLDDASPALNGIANTNMLRAKGAKIYVEDDSIRFREDGENPTATEGEVVAAGGQIVYNSWDVPKQNWRSVLKAIRFIRVANDAKLKIHYYD